MWFMNRLVHDSDGERQARTSDILQAIDKAAADGETETLDALLDEAHVLLHDRAGPHVRLHIIWMKLRWTQGRPLAAVWQIVALSFAAPASWAQRYLGLVRRLE